MKFVVKHEIRGRIRIHIIQKRMSYRQADTLQYHFSTQMYVTAVKVEPRTQDMTITYVGDRQELITKLQQFHWVMQMAFQEDFPIKSMAFCTAKKFHKSATSQWIK